MVLNEIFHSPIENNYIKSHVNWSLARRKAQFFAKEKKKRQQANWLIERHECLCDDGKNNVISKTLKQLKNI